MRYSRREAIALGGSGLATVLAGCQNSSSEDPPLDLKIYNYTPEPQEIEVRVVDPTEDDASEAEVYNSGEEPPGSPRLAIEIDGRGETQADVPTKRIEDIAEVSKYTVFARFYGSVTEQWRHHHYYPHGHQGVHQIGIRIYNDEDTNDSVIVFSTN